MFFLFCSQFAMKLVLLACDVMLKEMCISFYEFVPAAQTIQRSLRCWGLSHSSEVHLISRKMAEDGDFLLYAFENEERVHSTWHSEKFVVAKTERCFVTVHQRRCDQGLEDTKKALENVVSFLVGDYMSSGIGDCLHWEADLIRFCLGFVTAEEDRVFNEQSEHQRKLCTAWDSVTKNIGKAFTSRLRHGHGMSLDMDRRGAVELKSLFDRLPSPCNPKHQHALGRSFAAFLQGNNKSRFFLDIYLHA